VKGVFIAIEGIDGSGKTTIALKLKESLEEEGFQVYYTYEPSKGPIGDIIRKHVFNVEVRPNPYIEALLFAADRIDHLEKEIIPALNRGNVVICDRYLYSSIAYQGARGVPINWIRRINVGVIKPHVTVYIDVPPEVGLSRKKGTKVVTFENIDYLKAVRSIYLNLVRKGEMILVDGRMSIDEVLEKVLANVKNILSLRG